MNSFFSNLFSWWGTLSFYSNDMREFMNGYDRIAGDYTGSARFAFAGLSLLVLTAATFSFYYFVLDSSRYSGRKHWAMFLLAAVLLSGIVSWFIGYPALNAAGSDPDLYIGSVDCLGFAASAMIWSFILFVLLSLSPFPRKMSTNCTYTPWKN
ncbi:MAG: hypothetical protein ACRC3B_10830 [Bacteroidia bacterium]